MINLEKITKQDLLRQVGFMDELLPHELIGITGIQITVEDGSAPTVDLIIRIGGHTQPRRFKQTSSGWKDERP